MGFENHQAYNSGALAVSAASIGLPIPPGTTPVRATFQPTVGSIIFRYDGQAAVSATNGGFYRATNDLTILEGVDNILNFRVIRSGSTDVTMFFALERE